MNRSTERVLLAAVVLLTACSSDNNGHHDDDHHHHDDADHSHSADGGDDHHDGGHHHQDGGASHDIGPDATLTAEAFAYCDCMLVNCHDLFHGRWGTDDVEARNACAEAASGWPVAGSPQSSGDSLECRQFHCLGVSAGDSTCDDALGAACQ